MDCSPPGSSIHGILQARILDWVAVLSSRASSRPRDGTHVSFVSPALAGGFFTASATWEAPHRMSEEEMEQFLGGGELGGGGSGPYKTFSSVQSLSHV